MAQLVKRLALKPENLSLSSESMQEKSQIPEERRQRQLDPGLTV